MEKFELISLKIFNLWDPVEDKNFWEAVIEVPDNYSLFEFHLFIQHIINFDNDHLFDFYAGRNERINIEISVKSCIEISVKS